MNKDIVLAFKRQIEVVSAATDGDRFGFSWGN